MGREVVRNGVWHPADGFLNIDLAPLDLAHGTALAVFSELVVMLTQRSSKSDAAVWPLAFISTPVRK
jgi:hypothetical protein